MEGERGGMEGRKGGRDRREGLGMEDGREGRRWRKGGWIEREGEIWRRGGKKGLVMIRGTKGCGANRPLLAASRAHGKTSPTGSAGFW